MNMKNRRVSCGKYRLCGFLNLHPFFPAFLYPVFCKLDFKDNMHYFFEDGKMSTIQMFHEIDFNTFPELITPSNLGNHYYTVGSETVYAYALSTEHIIWGNVGKFIPLLKSILPSLQNHAQKKRVKSFIFSHWAEHCERSVQNALPRKQGQKAFSAEYCIECVNSPVENASAIGYGRKALSAIICMALLLIMVNSIRVSHSGDQTSAPTPSGPDDSDIFFDLIPDEDVPMLVLRPISPPDDDNSTVYYQRLNVTPSSAIIDYLTSTFVTGTPDIGNSDCHLESGDVLAVDSQSGKEYDIEELVDTVLLIPYRDGNQETFFYGSLSTEGNWDGRCVTNVYEDQKLKSVTDAYYDNGKLLSYKQMYTYVTAKDELVWAFSSRIVQEDNSRSGETWTYYHEDISQNFLFDNVTGKDIIFADHFDSLIECIGARKEGYYNGNTLNGTFNDHTGQAYMVKYFKEDGTVRDLYVGNIENGYPADQTGSAWEIGKKSIDQARYAHYIGTFSNGKWNLGTWTYNLTQEEIDAFLDGYTFNCPLPGLRPDEQEDMELPS